MRLGAIILAAGSSKRFGRTNKLLHRINGVPLLVKVLGGFERLELDELLVVTGHQSQLVENILGGVKVRTVFNPEYELGMGTSLACGVRSLRSARLDGLLVCLGDLPGLREEHVVQVINAFREAKGTAIVQPCFSGKRGHPVCFPNRYFEQLEKLTDDQGARDILAAEHEGLVFVEMEDDGCIKDLDTI